MPSLNQHSLKQIHLWRAGRKDVTRALGDVDMAEAKQKNIADVLCERDVPVKMCDGTALRCDCGACGRMGECRRCCNDSRMISGWRNPTFMPIPVGMRAMATA